MSIFVKNVLTLLNTYSEGQFLASEDPDAWDDAVIVGAKQEDTGEGILSEFVQTLEHTCEQGVERQSLIIYKDGHYERFPKVKQTHQYTSFSIINLMLVFSE